MELQEGIRALADPTRREIVRALRQGELTAGDLAARFPITAASVSHHLAVLRQTGLVQAQRDGRTIIYSLEQEAVQQFLLELTELLGDETSGSVVAKDKA